MNAAVPDSIVSGYEYLVPSITLPDPNDRHVVAAAVHGRADAIVTFNLRDFPSDELKKYGLESIHPDEFISFQNDLDESAVVVSAQAVRSRLKNPVVSAANYLETLRKQGLPKTVSILSPFSTVI